MSDPLPVDLDLVSLDNESLTASAAKDCDIDMLEMFYKNDCHFGPTVALAAIEGYINEEDSFKYDYVDVLEWLVDHGCEWPTISPEMVLQLMRRPESDTTKYGV